MSRTTTPFEKFLFEVHPDLFKSYTAFYKAKLDAREANQLESEARTRMLNELKKSEVVCSVCGASHRLGSMVMIVEHSGGYQSDDEWIYNLRYFVPCNGCPELLVLPQDILGFTTWSSVVSEYVNYYPENRQPAVAHNMLERHRAHKQKRYEESEKERKLEEARRLLRANGELP